MKGVLYVVGGALIGFALFPYVMKKKNSAATKPGAGTTDVVVDATAPAAPIMPSTMIQKFDAKETSTVAPAPTKIYGGSGFGAGMLDSVDHNSAALIVRD